MTIPRLLHPVIAAAATAVVVIGAVSLTAGPVDPPSGSVSASYKTLTEIEPRIAISAVNTPGDADSLFRITQPGSYYLTGNVTGVESKHGIEIASSSVSIDLMGFDVRGVFASRDGIVCTVAGATGLSVRNGTVRGWSFSGVDLEAMGASNGIVEGLRVSDNDFTGIRVGSGFLISNCRTASNAQGIVATAGSTVVNCSAVKNGLAGISVGAGSTITGCTAVENGTGLFARDACVVERCTASDNEGAGITVFGNHTLLLSNTSSGHTHAAFGDNISIVGSDCRIEGNNCCAGERGITVDGAGNVLVRNTCSGNMTNWNVAAGNHLLVIGSTPSGAVVGSFGGVGLGSTDPNANFSY